MAAPRRRARSAPAATPRASGGASTNHGRSCRDGRECRRAAASLPRSAIPGPGGRDPRPPEFLLCPAAASRRAGPCSRSGAGPETLCPRQVVGFLVAARGVVIAEIAQIGDGARPVAGRHLPPEVRRALVEAEAVLIGDTEDHRLLRRL